MDWIRVEASLPTHRKSSDLADLLGEEFAWARMVRVWIWVKTNAIDGRIAGRNPVRAVEAAAGWQGEPGAFVAAAVATGFLCREGEHLLVHDWETHNGRALKRAEEASARTRQWRERRDAERRQSKAAAQRTHTERIPYAERDVTRRNVTTTTTAAPPTPFRLEAETAPAASKAKLSPAQKLREQLRTLRATALPGVVDDIELKPAALTRTFERLEHEASAKQLTIADAYAAYLLDDYARTRNPPCPLGLFVDANKFRECLSAALRSRGKGPALTLVSSRRVGSYASLAEIEAQEFTVDPVEGDEAQEAP